MSIKLKRSISECDNEGAKSDVCVSAYIATILYSIYI